MREVPFAAATAAGIAIARYFPALAAAACTPRTITTGSALVDDAPGGIRNRLPGNGRKYKDSKKLFLSGVVRDGVAHEREEHAGWPHDQKTPQANRFCSDMCTRTCGLRTRRRYREGDMGEERSNYLYMV